jgi:hypothetical protein
MRRPILTFFSVLAIAGSASAGSISTPYLFAGGATAQNVCVAINVSKKPIEVTVETVPFADEPGEHRTETCTLAPLAAATVTPSDNTGTCETFMNTAGFCRFTTPGSQAATAKALRAHIINRDTNTPFQIFSVVEAR